MKNKDQQISVDDIAARLLKTSVGEEIDKIIASSRAAREPEVRAKGQFSAHVVYVQPTFEELKRRFLAFVDPSFEGKRFDPIERCKDVSREDREVAFECVHLDRDASTDEALAEMDRKGLRPALYEEVLGFALKYPDEQRWFPIVALGSFTLRGNSLRYVACLRSVDGGRRLVLDWVDCGWGGDCRFLAVRKSA